MSEISKINTVTEYNNFIGQETLHPLVSIIDFSKIEPFYFFRRQMGIYAIFLKEAKYGNLTYGCNNYDYEQGTLLFIAPGQVYGIEDNGEKQKGVGQALIFHPDLIHGTSLGRKIKEYTFFSYKVNEALHLSARERSVINDTFDKINHELKHAIDEHSQTLIVSYIELFLNYCKRFYDRQFITRRHANKDILFRFEKLLDEYFATDKPLESGLPSVSYYADKLFMSPNYLGDLLEK